MVEARPALLSLSAFGRGLVWAAIFGAMLLLGRQLGFRFGLLHRTSVADAASSSRIARRMIVYRLDPVRPTLFRFTLPITQTRIITQPVLGPGQASPGEGWTYSIRAELLDEAGQPIETRTVYARTVLFAPDGHRRGPYRYYRGEPTQIAPADIVQIAASRPFAAVRLLSAAADPDIVAIDVRVAERRPLIASTARSAFVRFSADDQARLSAANAFPPDLLTQDERTSIAVNQWRPVGPVGIDGRDYRMGVLYEESDPADDDGAAGE